jgi:serine protease inhibitor
MAYPSFTDGDLQFGLSMISKLGPGTIPISPLSLRMALSMLYEGATGDTAKEIAHAARIPTDDARRHADIQRLVPIFNASSTYKLRFASGIWTADDYEIKRQYVDLLTGTYRAEAAEANFKTNAEGERAGINKWVSDGTEGMIPQLFGEGTINRLTALVLANALYFEAPWDEKFDDKLTQPQDYRLSTGAVVKAPMMRKGSVARKLPSLQYGEFDSIQTALLPYQDDLAKLVILPPPGSSITDMEDYLRRSGMAISDILRRMGERKFERLEIPKHHVKGDFDLNQP